VIFVPRRAAAVIAAWVLLASLTAGSVHAGPLDCGQPVSTGATPTASDGLFVLRASVGVVSCSVFLCDVDGSCAVSATDALRVLRKATGQDVALACGLGCSIGSTVTRADFTLDPTGHDAVTIEGTFEEFPIVGKDGVIVGISDIEYELETSALTVSEEGTLLTYDAAGANGITQAEIDLDAHTFAFTLDRVFFGGLPNPFPFQLEFAQTTECRMVRTTPAGPETYPCVVSAPLAEPANLVEAPGGALRAVAGVETSADVELSVVLAGVEPTPGSVEVRRVLPGGNTGETVCTMAEDTAAELEPGARAFSCSAPLTVRDGEGVLTDHDLVVVAEASGSGSAGLAAGAPVSSSSITVHSVAELDAAGGADLQSVLGAASDLWETSRAVEPTLDAAEVAACTVIRNLEGVAAAGLTPDAIVLRTDSGAIAGIPTSGGYTCDSSGGACAVRCGEITATSAASTPASLMARLEDARRAAYAALDRAPAAQPPSALYARASNPHAEAGPTVISNRTIVLWDPNFFGNATTVFPDASDSDLLDPSVAGRSVEADRVIVRELVDETTCPKFTLSEFVGSAATLEALRQNAAAGGALVMITHGIQLGRDAGNLWNGTDGQVVLQSSETLGSLPVTGQLAHDIQTLRVIPIAGRSDFQLGVTAAFFRNLPEGFADTVVWGGACNSGRNQYPRLSDAFLAGGASVYYGFTRAVSDEYARLASELVFERLLAKRGTTDEAFADVTPRSDPLKNVDFRPSPRLLSLIRLRRQARFVMEKRIEATFLGEAEIEPGSPFLANDEDVSLTVALEGTEDCSELVYRWSNSGSYGTLADGAGGTDSFDSSSPSVTYTAASSGTGIDTVGVQVIVVEDGEESVLGEAEVSVEVSDQCLRCPVPGQLFGRANDETCTNPVEACCTDGQDNDDDSGTDCRDIDCRDDPSCRVEGNFSVRSLTFTNSGGVERYHASAAAFVDPIPGGVTYCMQVDTHGIPLPPPFITNPYPEPPPYEYTTVLSDPCVDSLAAEDEHVCAGWLGGQFSVAGGANFNGPLSLLQDSLDLLAPLTGWTFEGRLLTRDEAFCGEK